MVFADRLNKLINKKEISGYRLAKDLNIAYSAVRSWRTGQTKPREKAFKKIVDYFDCDPSWLRYGKEERLSAEVMQIARTLDKYRKKHPEEFDRLKRVVQAFIT